MAYLFLLGAITAEVIGTSLLKATDGFTRLWPTVASPWRTCPRSACSRSQ